MGVHPLLAVVGRICIGTRGDAVDLLAVPRAAQLLAKRRAHAIGHDDPSRAHAALADGELHQPVALELRGGRRAGEKLRAGFLRGLNEQRIEFIARQSRSHLRGVCRWPRGGHGAAEAVQLEPAVAIGSVDLDAEELQLVHGARGQPIATGLIAGEGGGVDKQCVMAGARGVDSGGSASGPGTYDGDVNKGGIDLL